MILRDKDETIIPDFILKRSFIQKNDNMKNEPAFVIQSIKKNDAPLGLNSMFEGASNEIHMRIIYDNAEDRDNDYKDIVQIIKSESN